jgi:hypothetical protein
MKTKTENRPRWLSRMVGQIDRLCEYAFVAFLGVAILGATDSYSLAAGVLLPMYWMRERSRRIAELERVLKIDADFWEKAKSEDSDLINTMRRLHVATLPNTSDEPRA